MTMQKYNKEKDAKAFKELCEITALLNKNAQRNAVTVPEDKLAELQRKAKLVDELVEVLEDIIERWDTPLWKDVPHTAEYIDAARFVVAKAKGEQ